MRQFDVFVWNSEQNNFRETVKPPFEDSALGWFFGNDINENLEKSDAEWIVFAKDNIVIDRNFLNDLAVVIGDFPMVDAFAPRLSSHEHFFSGSILDTRQGLAEIGTDAPLKFVAAPRPEIVAFSRRIVQRTGKFDKDFPLEIAIIDFSFRMLHAGGRMFSAPYLVAKAKEECEPIHELHLDQTDGSNLGLILFKSFGFFKSLPYLFAHPKAFKELFKRRKEMNAKREACILLSKLKPKFLKEISK